MIQNAAPFNEIGVATSMSQFSRQMGATVGVAIFGTLLTHALTAELPKHVPLLPGDVGAELDLAHAQSQAMNVDVDPRPRQRRRWTSATRSSTRAYHEDQAAVDEMLGDPRMPEQLKAPLRDGGIRARVHRTLVEKADLVERELSAGEEGRHRLLQDPALSAVTKQGLVEHSRARAARSGAHAAVADLFRKAILSREDAIVDSTAQSALVNIRAGMSVYATQLVERIQRGVKVAFATSIAHMLERALWIVGLAVLVTLFIPELPLRSRAGTAMRTRLRRPQPKARAAPEAHFFLLARRLRPPLFFFRLLRFFGTLAPARRASDKPIAIACLRLFTFLPQLPLRSVPRLRSLITFSTFFEAFLL